MSDEDATFLKLSRLPVAEIRRLSRIEMQRIYGKNIYSGVIEMQTAIDNGWSWTDYCNALYAQRG